VTETEEENSVETTIIDSKSGTGLYARSCGGRGGRRSRGGRGGRGGRDGRGGKGTRNRSCTYCSKDNHTTEDCWKRQKEQNQQQTRKRIRDDVDNDEIIFYQCGETGHMRNECPVKKRIDEIRERRNGKGKGKALLAIEDKSSSSKRVEEMYENQE
jgi:hypothetical protein